MDLFLPVICDVANPARCEEAALCPVDEGTKFSPGAPGLCQVKLGGILALASRATGSEH